MRSLSALALSLLVVSACGPGDEVFYEGDSEEIGGEIDAATGEIKVAVEGFTVWFQPALVPVVREGRAEWLIRGRASKNLSDAQSWVFDDVFGRATVVSARKFEVALDAQSELNSLTAGTRLFIRLTPTTGEGATAGLLLVPRFFATAGSSKLFVSEVIRPVHDDGLVYRGKVRTTGEGGTLAAQGEDGLVLRTGKRTALSTQTEWNVDFTFDSLNKSGDVGSTPVVLSYTAKSGATYTRTAQLNVQLRSVGLTRNDVEGHWPMATCKAAVQSCLNSLPVGETNTDSCGDYYPVTRCDLPSVLPELGLAPDDLTALNAELAKIRAQLPANKSLTVRDYYVQGRSDAAPPFDHVARAYLALQHNPALFDRGGQTLSQLNADLDGHGARGLVSASQTVVYQKSFQARKMTWDRMTAPNATEWHVIQLLWFPSAARLVEIDLVTNE